MPEQKFSSEVADSNNTFGILQRLSRQNNLSETEAEAVAGATRMAGRAVHARKEITDKLVAKGGRLRFTHNPYALLGKSRLVTVEVPPLQPNAS